MITRKEVGKTCMSHLRLFFKGEITAEELQRRADEIQMEIDRKNPAKQEGNLFAELPEEKKEAYVEQNR